MMGPSRIIATVNAIACAYYYTKYMYTYPPSNRPGVNRFATHIKHYQEIRNSG